MMKNIYKYAPQLLLLLGVLLRLKHYLENRSFWVDEAWLGVAITSTSYAEIFRNYKIFPGFPMPPLFFMLIEKFFSQTIGNNEMVLRLFPFLCGVGALGAFYLLARKFLSMPAFLLALAFFAILEPLVYYSAELKQYSLDLLVSILLLLFADRCLRKEWTNRKLIVLGCFGAISLWMAHAAIFILPAVALVLFLQAAIQKRWDMSVKVSLACVPWLVSFIVLYKVALSGMVNESVLIGNWQGSLLSGNLFSFQALKFLADVLWASFQSPCGLGWPLIGVVLLLLGAWRLVKKDYLRAILLILPIVLALTASLLGKYPFRGRMILFLLPSYLILMGLGFDVLVEFVKDGQRKFIIAGISVLLLLNPAGQAVYNLLQGRSQVENRPVLKYFNEHYQPGDFIYVNTTGQFAFWYYGGSLGYSSKFPLVALGVMNGSLQQGIRIGKYARSLGENGGRRYILFRNEYNIFDENGFYKTSLSLKSDSGSIIPEGVYFDYPDTGRSWVFVSRAPEEDDPKINAIIVDSFERRGKRLMSFEGKGAAVYLYDLHK